MKSHLIVLNVYICNGETNIDIMHRCPTYVPTAGENYCVGVNTNKRTKLSLRLFPIF